MTWQPVITVKLRGGLGNQMFQYAVARHLAILNDSALAIDATVLYDAATYAGVTPRTFDLDVFSLTPRLTKLSVIAKTFRMPYVYERLSRVGAQLGEALRKHTYRRERSIVFDGSVLRLRGNVYLDGYWQSERYFDEVRDEVRKDFTVRPTDPEVKRFGATLKAGKSVCLNIRRGDFLTSAAGCSGFVGLEYYRRALETMNECVRGASYYIFSDDDQWARESLVGLVKGDCVVVPRYLFGHKYADKLWLMTCCQHFVIANSTFGWWAAWLSARAGKMVIAPRRWFANETMDSRDLVPQEWLRL